ncbi:MAG: 3'(2'),5'-bisphosphate nucleotidase CysQ [Alphaproteobacteria bacterium]
MGQGKPTVDELADIAIAAGAAILDVYARNGTATAKADGSPVTEADTRGEEIILARLAAALPGIPVVSEEAVARGILPKTGERFFLVDPLDGTKEFMSRNGEFTVNIALVEAGSPTIGVVYLPALGTLYCGSGAKASRAEVKAGQVGAPVSIRARRPQHGLDILASRSHMNAETEAFLQRFKTGHLVQAGSSLKFCRIAEGTADLYPRLGRTMQWDTAAGDAVLRAAGGRVLTFGGRPLAYGPGGADRFANPHFVACGDFDPFGGQP